MASCSPSRGRSGEFGAVIMVSSGFPGVSQTLTLLVHARYIDDHNTYGAYAAATLLMGIALVVLLLMTVARPQEEQPMITVTGGAQGVRHLHGAGRRQPRDPERITHRPARPERVGKSTLLRAIAGLESLDSGIVTIGGSDVTNEPPQRRGIGFVFQHYAAFKHLTVRDNVAFGLTIRKRPKAEVGAKVDELLHVVGLEGFAAPLSSAAVRRPAAADGPGAGPCRGPAGAPPRRALRCARRQGARWTCEPGCAGSTTRST